MMPSRIGPAQFASVLFAMVAAAQPAAAQKSPDAPARGASAFELAAVPYTWTQGNELVCGVQPTGRICTDHHPGFWPAGTENTHMYAMGAQLTAIIPRAPGCTVGTRATSRTPDCFPWAGDTTGAFFHEPSGNRTHAVAVDGIHDSRPQGTEPWPNNPDVPGFPTASTAIDDADVFHPSLIGLPHISTHDTWTAYRDGESRMARTSPLGVLVEQRTLTWNYPEGNESTIYVVYRLTNITNTDVFQHAAEAEYFDGADRLPDEGWPLDSMYFAAYADPDIGLNQTLNLLTASLPFDMLLAYQGTFRDPGFTYPVTHFHPPFFTDATSLVGVHFVRTPGDRGMTAVTSYTGGGAFPLPSAMPRAWRTFSLNLSPALGDPLCSVLLEHARRLGYCWLGQVTHDVRGIIVTGPFSLAPGESETVVVAITAAATVATERIRPGNSNPPGWPTPAPGCGDEPVRAIEEGAGWLRPLQCPVEGRVDAMHVSTVDRSLLGRAQVARAVAETGFLLPAAPAAPEFEVSAVEGGIFVRWQPSRTEDEGDAYADVASDPSSPLHDPAFRRFDVEGYRIWRGTSADGMELIAQFDHTGTTFVDALCRTVPEHIDGEPCDAPPTVPLDRELVQYSVVRAHGGGTIVLQADTALAHAVAEGSAQPLRDSGVPFEFVDSSAVAGQRYFYSVTAFDINSIRSAPSSMESPRITREARFIAARPLSGIHTVPDPYYASSVFDVSPTQRRLRFVNIPTRATIRIFTVSGVLVDVIVHDEPAGVASHVEWDLRGRGNHRVRSGVYLYHVTTPDGQQHVGRFTVLVPPGG